MRIYFKTLSRADRYLACCKKAILEYVPEVDRGRVPTQQLRNAFCLGVDYTSYDDLRRTVLQNHPAAAVLPDVDSLRESAIAGFSEGIQILGRVFGVSHFSDPRLPARLTETVIVALSKRGDLRDGFSRIDPVDEKGGLQAMSKPAVHIQEAVYRKIPETESLYFTIPVLLREGDAEQAHELALRGVELLPHSVTFLLFAARSARCSVEERISLLKRALAAAERYLPASGTLKDQHHREWSKAIDALRPGRSVPQTSTAQKPRGFNPDKRDREAGYKALKYLAVFLLVNNRVNEATPHFKRLYRLNPEDLFVSCSLIACYLASVDEHLIALAKALLDQDMNGPFSVSEPYGEDDYIGDALHAWSRALERFLRGDLDAARRALAWARMECGQFEDCLLGRTPYPQIEAEEIYDNPHAGLLGTAGVAISDLRSGDTRECIALLGPAWQAHPEAIEWLRRAPYEDVPLKKKPKAPKVSAPERFFVAKIEGRTFRAALSHLAGPVLVAEPSKTPLQHGGRARISVSTIRPADPKALGGPERWFVVPDGHRPAIDISGMTESGRRELSRKFGIPIAEPSDNGLSFLTSEACEAFCRAVLARPQRYYLFDASINSIAGLPEKLHSHGITRQYIDLAVQRKLPAIRGLSSDGAVI